MGVVRLSDLSEEERKKVLREQQERLERNRQASEELRRNANRQFNTLTNRRSQANTNSTISSSTNQDSSNNNNESLWDKITRTMSNFGRPANTRNNMQFYNNGQFDFMSQAQKNNDNAVKISQMNENKKKYDEAEKEAIRNTYTYKNLKMANPDASDEELLKMTKEKQEEQYNTNVQKISNAKTPFEREQLISKTTGVNTFNPLDRGNPNKNNDNSNLILKDNKSYVNQLRKDVVRQQASNEAEEINKTMKDGSLWDKVKTTAKVIGESAGSGAIEMTASPFLALESIQNSIPGKSPYKDQAYSTIDNFKTLKDARALKQSSIESEGLKTASQVASTIGGMVPAIATSAFAPGTNLAKVVQGVTVGGSGHLDNLNEEQSNVAESFLTGGLKGAASYAIESVTGGNFLGKGSFDDVAIKNIANKLPNKTLQKVASKGYEVAGENFEELLENQVGYVIDSVVNDKGITMKEWLEDQKETVKNTTLTQLVLNVLGLGGNTYNKVKKHNENAEMNKWINEAQKIIKNDNINLNSVVTNANQQTGGINNNVQLKALLSDMKKSENTNVQGNNNVDIQNINTKVNNNMDLQNNNIDVNNVYRSSAIENNIDVNNETVKTIEQVLSNRGIQGKFDSNLFKNNNENAIWRAYKDEQGNVKREVIFNPNLKTDDDYRVTMQQVAVHELMHDMQGSKADGFGELKDLVLGKNKTLDGYDGARKALEDAYSQVYDPNSKEFKDLIDEEELADTLARKLGDQEFVSSLNTEKPNVFKQIYSWVVDKLNKFTGSKIEKLYWEDVKNKFENIYRQDYQGSNIDTKYHVSENFSNEIDKALNNELKSNTQVKARDYTPQILVKNGVQDLPMLITQKHIKSIIYTPDEATKLKLPTKNINYHGLGKDLLIKAIDNLDSPKEIYKTNDNNYLIITEFKDNNNREIVVPIQINGKGRYNDVFIDENQIKSVYGRNRLSNYIKNNNFEKIYTKKESSDFNERIQYPNVAELSNNSILPTTKDVNSTTNNSIQEDVKYSVGGIKGIKNIINSSESEKGLKSYKLAKELVKKGKSNKEIFHKTGWFQDKVTREMKFNFSDKDMDILPNNYEIGKEYKLGDILKHNTLFELYPQLKDYKVVIKDMNINRNKKTLRGAYNRYNDNITLDYRRFNEKRDVEGTLIHEIQHAIQKIENFTGGASKIWGKKFYQNNPGEIEARDTSDRLIEEKYNGKNLENIMPKSGNIEISVLDKMKLGLYNYLRDKKGGLEANEYNSQAQGKNTQNNRKDNRLVLGRIANDNGESQSNEWQDFLDKQIGKTGKGQTIQEVKLPTKEIVKNSEVDAYNVLYQDNKQIGKVNLPTAGTEKARKHYKTIMQSSNTTPEAKRIAQELMGTDTYIPDSNKRQLQVADTRIETNGADNEAITLATKVRNNDKITAEDIATGERLIEYYSKTGNKEKLQDTIQNVALAGTQAGQTVQAMSLINRQTPQGQAVYLQKVVDRMNKDIDRKSKGKGKKFKLTPEMLEKITNSSKENLETNIDEVAKELANQVPKTTIEKIDSWRYFSMLANPRTHIRNIIGNLSMASVQTVKNKVAGGLETIAKKTGMIDERTKTLKPASLETRKFAKSDVSNVMARLNNESKFDTRNLIQQYQRTFKNDILENTLGKLYNLNSKALEGEDIWGLKRAYRKSLADYMTANKLTQKDLTAGTKESDILLEKARKYAIEQAKEATFHQQSAMASLLNTFENKNIATRLFTGAVIPFKKTPINVAKTGASYSPLGLVKAFTLDIANLRNGKITPNQYIDNIAKGLTGTAITTVGYALAQAGILSASGGDDEQKNQYYKQDRGNQAFSITIGDKTYSLDWLSPTAIPLFIGAELQNNVSNSGKEQTTEDILDQISNGIDAMSSAMNPMIEMSMLSGVASTIKGFAQGDTQVFQNLAINAGKSYVNQFFPTLGGQIAKIVDDTERSTTSTKQNPFAKAVDSTGKQILNKIPFASMVLPAKTDVWGNVSKREAQPLLRALQQMVFPWTEKSLKSTNVDNSISDLYEATGENSVLPNTSINKDFTIDGEKYRLTSEEYANYKKQYGKNSYNLLNGLTSSKEYKNMNNEQKINAIKKIYEYANEKNKINYANSKAKKVEKSSLYNTITSIEKEGGKGADYFKYLGQITGVEKSDEKIKILQKSSIPQKSKASIYSSTIGKSDELYKDVLKNSNININEYLKYKTQEFKSDKKDDGTLKGKSVTNSKKDKVFDFVNNKMDIDYEQRLVLLGRQYSLPDNEKQDLLNYIEEIIDDDKKLDIISKFKGFKVYKNGYIKY